MKFRVGVTRIGYSQNTIEVEAENEEQAKERAVEEAGNYSFSEYDADYEPNFVEKV